MTTPQATDIIALYRGRAGLPGATFTELSAAIAAGGAVPVQDDGVEIVAAPSALNFIGLGVAVANVAGVAGITIPVLPYQDETVEIVANPSAVNFAGAGVVVTDVAGVATVTIAGAAAVPVEDEGTEVVAAPTALNFIGAGVTAADNGGVADITIPGAGAAATIVFKGTTTTRASTASVAADPDLVFTGVATGFYFMEFFCICESASADPDFKMAMVLSAGMVIATDDQYDFESRDTLAINQQSSRSPMTTDSNPIALNPNEPRFIRCYALFEVTTTGTIAFGWSQNVSDVASVSVLEGGFGRLLKLN